MILKTKRYPFYVGITALVVAIVIILTGLFLYISHRESKVAAIQMASHLFSEINTKTLERYENALGSVAVLAGSAARMPNMANAPVADGLSHPGLELMLEALAFFELGRAGKRKKGRHGPGLRSSNQVLVHSGSAGGDGLLHRTLCLGADFAESSD